MDAPAEVVLVASGVGPHAGGVVRWEDVGAKEYAFLARPEHR
jgi:hypothetical protein